MVGLCYLPFYISIPNPRSLLRAHSRNGKNRTLRISASDQTNNHFFFFFSSAMSPIVLNTFFQ